MIRPDPRVANTRGTRGTAQELEGTCQIRFGVEPGTGWVALRGDHPGMPEQESLSYLTQR